MSFALPPKDEKAGYVQQMFARIAPVYDLLNHTLSVGIDIWWRKVAARRLEMAEGQRGLDVACGTGDLTREMARRTERGQVVGIDFCEPMVTRAKDKMQRSGLSDRVQVLVGDGEGLPFPDASFDRVSIAYGIRNMATPEKGLAEMFRVLKPGGRIAVLEFSRPRFLPLRMIYDFYFLNILPLIGKMVSGEADPYRYLPESVMKFAQRDEFAAMMAKAGFVENSWCDLTFGITSLYLGNKEAPDR